MAFKIDPQAALAGASAANLSAVVIIGQAKNGRLVAFSSVSMARTLDLIQRAPAHLDSLTVDERSEEDREWLDSEVGKEIVTA